MCKDSFSTVDLQVSAEVRNSGTWENHELSELMWALEAPLPSRPRLHPTNVAGASAGPPALFVDVGA